MAALVFFDLAGEDGEGRKFAEFASYEEQQKYVRAECKACSRQYKDLAVEMTIVERKAAKRKLDKARWEFYQKWLTKTQLEKKVQV